VNRHTTRAAGAAAIAAGLALSTLAVGTAPTASAADPAVAGSIAPFLAPYYTEGDLTGDSQVTQADLDALSAALGTKVGDAGWEAVAPADLNKDEKIDVLDLAALAQKVIYDDGSFELVEASALDMQKAMNAGVITSVELTQDYLDRIAAYDTTVVDTGTGGRALNAIIATGGEALAAAAESDALRAENGGPRSMLDGIPILLKDNYDTKDFPTTAGCACWEGNQTADDAFMVQGLRGDGAVILGKASLDEFAYGFSSTFSAGSAFNSTTSTNGSKLVASPYATSKTAGGSSGGTGASISANLGGIGFGTDTGGSIRNPSSYNQLVGVRPTVGLASRDGIVPLALSQDTGGPIARSVTDAAIALDAVVGSDPNDPVTAGADSHVPDSYTESLDPDALRDKHVVYFTSMVPASTATNAAQVAGRRIFLDAVAKMRAAGATVTEVDPSTLAADPETGMTIAKILSESSGSTNEFKHDLNDYIAQHLDPDVTLRTLGDIYTSKKYVPTYGSTYNSRNNVTPSAYDEWMAAEEASGTHSHALALKNGGAYLAGLMDSQDWDAVIYPTALPYTTYSNNLRLSPNTGMPSVTVPAGQTTASETLPGAGVNLEILGRDYAEGDLLGMAYSFEQATKARTTPSLYGALEGDVVAGPGTDTDDAGDGKVTVTSSATDVAVGDTVTVTVDEAADDLYAYGLSLGYDPAALAFVSATSGTTGSTATSAEGGTLTVTHTKLGTSPGAEGDTTLGTITFKALKPGASTVAVTSVTSVDSEGTAATATAPGSVTVTVPAPPVTTPAEPTTTPTTPVTPTEPVEAAKAKTVTRLKLSPGTVKDGRKVTVHVTVSAPTGTPTGTVDVMVAGKKVGTATLKNGKATIRFVARRGGGHGVASKKVVVSFDPTGDFTASSSSKAVKIKKSGRTKKHKK
jgi:amidase